ncbi:MAG: hypothetical protein ACRDOA_08090 [Streptosporangiaceae bacterium]
MTESSRRFLGGNSDPAVTGPGAGLGLLGSGLATPLISERRLTSYPNLWGYARDLYQHPPFRETTDFAAFGGLVAGPRPSFVNDARWRIDVEPAQADWDAPHHRETLAA